MSKKARTCSVERMMWDNGPESGAVEAGLISGSLKGVGGYDRAMLQNGHGGGAVGSMSP
jgi:hypothetical protein